jgi:hypothetical protein
MCVFLLLCIPPSFHSSVSCLSSHLPPSFSPSLQNIFSVLKSCVFSFRFFLIAGPRSRVALIAYLPEEAKHVSITSTGLTKQAASVREPVTPFLCLLRLDSENPQPSLSLSLSLRVKAGLFPTLTTNKCLHD